FNIMLPVELDNLAEFLQQLFDELEIYWQWNEETGIFSGNAKVNTWSRAARRQRLMKSECQAELPTTTLATNEEPLFEFACHLELCNNDTNATKLTISWTSGKDRGIFESFYGHVKKRLEQEFDMDE
ncbi:7142_t:CDS:1, partial [Acaulospora colombiana]